MRLETEREAKQLEAEGKTSLLEQKEMRLFEAQQEAKMCEIEEAEKNRISELQKTRIKVNLSHGQRRGE